ncbi:MAG: gliding motility-associated C-terminal domain-containing protein [Cytophagaceae bacterium]|nr:gliding motility-associated C-terminal domain-containing protein [Cytophagaceae bacterium]
MNKFFAILTILLIAAHTSVWAATPNWVVDNPNQYEHSMTITAVLNIDGHIADEAGDKVGAFIDGVCMGVASPSNDMTADGRKLVYLYVKSSQVAGKTITFKLYDASVDMEFDAINTLVFHANDIIGADEPYLITTNRNPTDITPSSFTIMEGLSVNAKVGAFAAADPDGQSPFIFTLIAGLGDDNNVSFIIKDDSVLRTAAVFDYQVKSLYKIRVKADDGKGGTLEKAVEVFIIPDPNNFSSLNYISPNGDGKNDLWTIRNVEIYKDFTVSIFNDAGNQIYSTTNYQNDWDGTYQGKELPVGVYYYLVKSPEGSKFTGTITLNR